MYNDELSALLRRRLDAEQKEFRNWLVRQPAEDIMKYARQYAVREDIIAIAECNDLPDKQTDALLNKPRPLEAVYAEFQRRAPYYDAVVLESLEACSIQAARQGQSQRPSIREQLISNVAESGTTGKLKEERTKAEAVTNEQLNAMLYEKAAVEQEKYKHWLTAQRPESILDHAYEYTMRETILMELGEMDLPSSQAKSLLDLPDTMGVLYKDFQKLDAVETEAIRTCIEQRAESELIHSREQRPSIREQLKAASEQAAKSAPKKKDIER